MKFKKKIKEDNLQFGISNLHAWIRLFECLLHASYKLDVKKWQNRGEDKQSIETRKKTSRKVFVNNWDSWLISRNRNMEIQMTEILRVVSSKIQ